ncbi:unnamed protein product [Pieris brassicae]|uniref:Major facilitator superfamily (MFS) profile domain-containing protein n=1 Tax=Pieris brassicae TaxID=7116 RepID=A0A9P0T056_PIEBR|nr:unnamed protein product [Pieris brassicae]
MPSEKNKGRLQFDDALEASGFGKYNYSLLGTCCVLILGMYVDIFGLSVLLPSISCDFALTKNQQGLLSALPLIGTMISSYVWGLCADTLGRRKTILLAMPIGSSISLLTSLAPNFTALCILRFFSACFLSSANTAAFVLMGESVPSHHRSQFMFLMASSTMIGQLSTCLPALGIFRLSFHIEVPWLHMVYRPWRLLLQILCLPGIVMIIAMIFFEESPKFLLSKGRDEEALEVLKKIFKRNTGSDTALYKVTSVYLEHSEMTNSTEKSVIKKVWNQMTPLFKPPLLKNSLQLYFILLCAYMTSTGFTMWIPTVTNAYFDNDSPTTGKTFCEIASSAARRTLYKNGSSLIIEDCDDIIKPNTLYAVMAYSGLCGALNILLTFLVGPLGKKTTTLIIFIITISCGVFLLFVRIPMLSILLFFIFPYMALILGNINTYLVELTPTYLRGMATCLSVLVARGFGSISVQVIASFLADYCVPLIISYVLLGLSGLIAALFLPADVRRHAIQEKTCKKCSISSDSIERNKF